MKKLFLQAVRFVGLSGIGWLLDFSTYTVLGFFSKNLIMNNMLSSCVGLTFVFTFATRKVFQDNGKIPLKWKYVIYLIYQLILVFFISKLLNRVDIMIVDHVTIAWIVKFSSLISKMLVTPVTMTLNFCVMKTLVEKL